MYEPDSEPLQVTLLKTSSFCKLAISKALAPSPLVVVPAAIFFVLAVIVLETDIPLAASSDTENVTLSPETADPEIVTAKPSLMLKVLPVVKVNVPELAFVVRLFKVNASLPVKAISNSSTETVVGLALVMLTTAVPVLSTS